MTCIHGLLGRLTRLPRLDLVVKRALEQPRVRRGWRLKGLSWRVRRIGHRVKLVQGGRHLQLLWRDAACVFCWKGHLSTRNFDRSSRTGTFLFGFWWRLVGNRLTELVTGAAFEAVGSRNIVGEAFIEGLKNLRLDSLESPETLLQLNGWR